MVHFSLIGVIVVSRSDSEMTAQPNEKPPSRPLLGDTMALLSALCYACYVSLIKIRAGQESRLDMPKFLGFVGLINIVLLWPTGLLLHLTGIETFEAPRSRSLFLAIVVNSFITFVSDFLYIVSMLLTTPLTVTLGLSLTIPLAIFGDMALGHAFGGWKAVCGAALVVASFAIVGWADKEEEARVSETD